MPVWILSRRVESCEFPLRGRSSVGEHLKPAPQPPSRNQSTKQDRFFWKPGKLIARKPQPSPMETVGFEPTTPCLQSRCSPTELRPLRGNSQLSTCRDKNHTGISHIRPAKTPSAYNFGLRSKNTSPVIDRAAMQCIAGRFSIPPGDLFCASRKINGPGRT